jgi:uncharacterized RDD family membrane protein YckC
MIEASGGKRFLNYLIDRLTLAVFCYIYPRYLDSYIQIMPRHPHSPLVYVYYLLAGYAYYFLMEYYLGKTLGKFLTKTLVVDVYGNKPSAREIAIRTLCRAIPFDSLSFVIATDGWHDGLSGTRVVTDDVPYDEARS